MTDEQQISQAFAAPAMKLFDEEILKRAEDIKKTQAEKKATGVELQAKAELKYVNTLLTASMLT